MKKYIKGGRGRGREREVGGRREGGQER